MLNYSQKKEGATAMPNQATSAVPHFSFESTLGELIENPHTHALMEEMFPGLADFPLLELGRGYPFVLARPYLEMFLDREKIEAFRLRLEEIPLF